MSELVQKKLLARIYGKGRGWAFSPKKFFDLGSETAVSVALSRLVASGTIRRLARGLYDYPKKHSDLGLLSPTPEAVAEAIATREGTKIQPSGAYSLNLLGLTEQVPAKIVFLTDGPSRTVNIGNQEIQLKRTTPSNMAAAGRTSGLVIQALRHLGKEHVDDDIIERLQTTLTAEDRKALKRDHIHAPAWMHSFLKSIASYDE